ncbi:MAG TPA: hypothetical protein VNH11_21470 [Pirellulales bacterium]|nr:hypothetical protein [Pirellulales bacterium]
MSKNGRVWLAVLALGVAGCGIGQGQLARQIFRPGPFEYQKQQAVRFDPYAEQETFSHNRDDTMRPRDYSRPIPEPARGRWPQWGAPRYGY